jgi:hypothetical protein
MKINKLYKINLAIIVSAVFYYLALMSAFGQDNLGKHADSEVFSEQPVNKINFALLKEFPKEFYANSMLVDDIDGDGKIEIVYKTGGNENNGNIYVRSADWTLKAKCFAGDSDNSVEKLITADLNNDGKKELVTIALADIYDSNSYRLKIFDRNCQLIKEFPVKSRQTKKLFIRDIDGDGVNELLAVTGLAFTNENHVYSLKINQQDIKDRELVEISPDDPLYQKIIEADDGFMSKPSGKFVINQKAYDFSNRNVSKVDLFNDSKMETVILVPQPGDFVGETMILVFDEDGELLWNYNYPTWIDSIAFGDINGDGAKEIIVAGHYTAPISVFGKK